MFKAYFDESGTHKNSYLVCVAGYLFSCENAIKFGELWKKNVKPLLPNNVEVFHAADCYAKINDFKGISDEHRDAIFEAMVIIIINTIELGIVVGVNPFEYESVINKHDKIKPMIGTKYTLCSLECAEHAAYRLLEKKLDGNIFYYFENGCSNRGELNIFLKNICGSPEKKQKYRINNYNFLDKNEAVQLQAADLLAWEWQRSYATAYQPGFEKRPWRMILKELVKKPHRSEHITDTAIIKKVIGIMINKANLLKNK